MLILINFSGCLFHIGEDRYETSQMEENNDFLHFGPEPEDRFDIGELLR